MKNVVDECLNRLKYYDVLISAEAAKIMARCDVRKRQDYEEKYAKLDKQNLKKIQTYIKHLYDKMSDILKEDA